MVAQGVPPPDDLEHANQPKTPVKRASIQPGWMRNALAAQNRERKKLLGELTTVRGLMPLLMKVRNGDRWSTAERADIQFRLRALAHVSPYLLVMALPGSFVALPALAWWLDRRRQNRGA